MKLHNLIEGVWKANGAVYMRVKKVSKPYRLNKLEDLMGLQEEYKNCKSPPLHQA